jgi:hypothetical protein
MIYNKRMTRRLALLLLLATVPLRAADTKSADAGTADADATTVQIAEYFQKVPLSDANPKLVEPFLAIDSTTLPKKLRAKTQAKQLEIKTLLKLHDTKKKGNWLQPATCTADSFVKPLKDSAAYAMAGYVNLTEDEEQYIMHKTQCTETDMGCQFSMTIFHDKGKPRRLMIHPNDPLAALAAESHGKAGGQTQFFGLGLTCQH